MTTNAADTNNAHHVDLVDDARQIAREAIRETWPTVVEIAEPTDGMYEFDAICIDEEECPVSAIAIMHDPDAETFALIEEARVTPAVQQTITPEAHKPTPAWPIDWERLKQYRRSLGLAA